MHFTSCSAVLPNTPSFHPVNDVLLASDEYGNYGTNGVLNTVLYVGGQGADNYSTIQDAVDDASDGDTIFVYGSPLPYYEHVIITSSITLCGENQKTTIIDGLHNGSVISIRHDTVVVTGFTIQHSGYDIFHEWDAGIELTEVDFCEISSNILRDNYIGIHQSLCGHIQIINNSIYSNYTTSDGIICEFSDDTMIAENVFGFDATVGRDALYMSHSTDCIVSANLISNYQNGLRFFRSNANSIEKNWLSQVQMLGVQMQYCGNNAVQNNSIIGCRFGIILEYVPLSCKNYILGNDFIDNDINAFYLELYSGKNIWYRNYWNAPRIVPKVIVGIIRDPENLHTGLATPVFSFDLFPSMKRNNMKNQDTYFPSTIQRNHMGNLAGGFDSLSQEKTDEEDIMPVGNPVALFSPRTTETKQYNSYQCGIEEVNISVGDLIFMDCKRYSPAHSRPGNYSDHVAIYIGEDPVTKEKLFVETIPHTGPRISTMAMFEQWAYHFALGRVMSATEQQKMGAAVWATQLCFERNKPISTLGDRLIDNYQYLPTDYDLMGCWKSYLIDGIESYSEFWYCSELVWASYYNIDKDGNLNLYQEDFERVDIDLNDWSLPFVVLPIEIFYDDDVEIYYRDPL